MVPIVPPTVGEAHGVQQQQQQVVKLRLHYQGRFERDGDSSWRYTGGEVFNESVPRGFRYADLCRKLNDKFCDTVYFKYLSPGDDLNPDGLIGVTDDDDLQELFGEYDEGLKQQGGGGAKVFRIKVFVYPACQSCYEVMHDDVPSDQDVGEEIGAGEAHYHSMASTAAFHAGPNFESYCSKVSDEASEPSAVPSSDTEVQLQVARHNNMGPWPAPWADAEQWNNQPFFGHGHVNVAPAAMQVSPALYQQPVLLPRPPVLPQAAVPAQQQLALLHPPLQQAAVPLHREASGPAPEDGLEDLAIININRSVYRQELSYVSVGNPFNPETAEGFEVDDPYSEQDHDQEHDAVLAAVTAAAAQHQQQRRGGSAGALGNGHAPMQWGGPAVAAEGVVGQGGGQDAVAMERDSPDKGMLPLAVRRLRDAANLPSHISIFGDTASRASSMGAGAVGANGAGVGADGSPDAGPRTQVDKSLGLNLPSHISIFGDGPEGEELQQLQELAAQQAQQHQQQQHPGRMAGGAWGLAVEDSAIVDGVPNSKCITQEFDNADMSLLRGNQAGLPPLDFDLPNSARDVDMPGEVSPGTLQALQGVVKKRREEVFIVRKIGEGAFGEVSQAHVFPYGSVAVKWLKRERFAKYSESFNREAEVLARLNHPNIIRMYGMVVEGAAGHEAVAGIMTEFVRNGSLTQLLRNLTRPLTLKERCHIAWQATLGMAYLHDQSPAVIHFDLKPDNLLVDGEGDHMVVKVADFGLSKHKFHSHVSCRDLRGTLPYMAPELVNNPNMVSEKCDVWSMGVVMWELLTLEVPFHELSAQHILMALMKGRLHLPVPQTCEDEWRCLIEACMDADPTARPSFKQLATHLQAILEQLTRSGPHA